MTDYTALKRLAEAATPGPWSTESNELYWLEDGYTKHLMEAFDGSDICHDAEHPANLKFIAAANPAAVLALIAENEQLSSRPLQGELNAAMDLISTYRRVNRELRSERYQLKAEVEALRERAEGLRKGLHAASRAMWTSEADMDLQAAAADRVLSGDYSEVTP